MRGLLPSDLRATVFGRLAGWYPKLDWAPRPLRFKSTLLALADDGDEAYARALGVTTPALRPALFTDATKPTPGGHRAADRHLSPPRDPPAPPPPEPPQSL